MAIAVVIIYMENAVQERLQYPFLLSSTAVCDQHCTFGSAHQKFKRLQYSVCMIVLWTTKNNIPRTARAEHHPQSREKLRKP